MNNKILMICSDSNSIINFRRELILFLKKKKYHVYLIYGDKDRENEIKKMGVESFYLKFSNRTKNPMEILKLKKGFEKIIKEVNPFCILTYQIKANIAGSLAAKKFKDIKIFPMIEGVGDPFQPCNFFESVFTHLIALLYRISFKKVNDVFFLNSHDKETFKHYHILKRNYGVVINGIGINTADYSNNIPLPKEKRVTCFSRLIKNKGIFEFCKVAKYVKNKRSDIEFYLYGKESQLTTNDIKDYIEAKDINYCGYVNDVKKAITSSRIVFSMSHREGFPRIILEAFASKRTVVASDVIGNNSIISNDEIGFLTPLNDIKKAGDLIIEIIDNDNLLTKISEQAYQYCLENLDSNIINEQILSIILEK